MTIKPNYRPTLWRLALAFCALIVLTSSTASAQEQQVTLPGSELSLAELFQEIKRQTGTTVIFDAGNIHPTESVSLGITKGSTSELLNRALPTSKYAWRTLDGYVVVRTLATNGTSSSTAATESALEGAAGTSGSSSATTVSNHSSATSVSSTAHSTMRSVRNIAPQPTRADFEHDVAEYTRKYIPKAQPGSTTTVTEPAHTGTIRREMVTTGSLDGVFDYPNISLTPRKTNIDLPLPLHRQAPLLALKTNLVWWAAATPNAAVEVSLGRRTTAEFALGVNPWHRKRVSEFGGGNKKLTHWVIKPEFRYWFFERFYGHFVGVHAMFGTYNIGQWDIPLLFEKDYRYHGTAVGGGVNYGYHWVLGKRLGLEFTVGAGVIHMNYSKNECFYCGDEIDKESKTYFGPTQAGVKLVIMLK